MSFLSESILINNRAFQAGDNVVVAERLFQCTPGVFLKLKDDVNWAEIKEYNGIVRSHPVILLRHSRAFHAAVKVALLAPHRFTTHTDHPGFMPR